MTVASRTCAPSSSLPENSRPANTSRFLIHSCGPHRDQQRERLRPGGRRGGRRGDAGSGRPLLGQRLHAQKVRGRAGPRGSSTPAGSTARFAARSASANGSGRWRSYQGRWSRPTAWWWVIVPPASITALRDRRLDLVPLLHLAAAPGGAEHRVVGRRAVGVDVREAARQARRARAVRRRPAGLGDRRRGGLHHAGVELAEALPGDRGLEGVREDAEGDERVAQVGGGEEGVAPCANRRPRLAGGSRAPRGLRPGARTSPAPAVVPGGLERDLASGPRPGGAPTRTRARAGPSPAARRE